MSALNTRSARPAGGAGRCHDDAPYDQAYTPGTDGCPLVTNRMAQQTTQQRRGTDESVHEHRTAKVIELIGVSTQSFEDAIRNAVNDASQTTRGITGAHVMNQSVKCDGGEIVEYKVNVKVAFGVETTGHP